LSNDQNNIFPPKNRPDKPGFGARRRHLATCCLWNPQHYIDLSPNPQEQFADSSAFAILLRQGYEGTSHGGQATLDARFYMLDVIAST
jgi:hypothetical protein